MFKLIALAISLGLGGVGCSADADEPIQFEAALEDAQRENTLHASRCLNVDSTGAMAAEMARHRQVMPGAFAALDQALSHMGTCFSGAPTSLHEMTSTLRANDEAHCQRMSEATVLTAQAAECQDYTDTTRIKLDQLSRMMEMTGGHCTMM